MASSKEWNWALREALLGLPDLAQVTVWRNDVAPEVPFPRLIITSQGKTPTEETHDGRYLHKENVLLDLIDTGEDDERVQDLHDAVRRGLHGRTLVVAGLQGLLRYQLAFPRVERSGGVTYQHLYTQFGFWVPS